MLPNHKKTDADLTAGVSFKAEDLPVTSMREHPHQSLSSETHHVLHNTTQADHYHTVNRHRFIHQIKQLTRVALL